MLHQYNTTDILDILTFQERAGVGLKISPAHTVCCYGSLWMSAIPDLKYSASRVVNIQSICIYSESIS